MKKFLLFGIVLISINLFSQNNAQIKIEQSTPGNFDISMRVTSGYLPLSSDLIGGLTFGLGWPTAMPITLGARTTSYGLAQEGGALNVSGSFTYRNFNSAGGDAFPVDWTLNTWYVIMSIPATGGTPVLMVDGPGPAPEPELLVLVDGAFPESYSMEIALPIRLQSFTAKKFAANTSLLEWTTASEDNASHMEIERSMDAKSWSYVATEKARGSLNYSTDYSFVDAEAVLQRNRFTTVYYRLKLVDNDGSSEYSEVRSVTFDNNGIVSLEAYPNPSTEVINLRMAVGETNTNTAQMMMLDMTGKLVKKQTVSANGISVLEVDQLETGVYNIIVKHEDKTYQKRVIKTN